MRHRLPERIDPFRLPPAGRGMSGRIELARLSRLKASLVADEGEAEVELLFDTDDQGVHRVEGHIRCTLTLECQRCLEPVRHEVDTRFELALVQSEAQAQGLPTDAEPLVVETATVSIPELVEDELILGLPLVPRHATDEACHPTRFEAAPAAGGRDGDGGEDTASGPFAELARLKRDES